MAEAEKSARHKQIEARAQRVAALMPRESRVRVVPRDETIRKAIRHPNGMAFPAQGSVEWPNDSFTKRRIRDGTVTLDASRQAAAKPVPPKT